MRYVRYSPRRRASLGLILDSAWWAQQESNLRWSNRYGVTVRGDTHQSPCAQVGRLDFYVSRPCSITSVSMPCGLSSGFLIVCHTHRSVLYTLFIWPCVDGRTRTCEIRRSLRCSSTELHPHILSVVVTFIPLYNYFVSGTNSQ